MHAPYTRTVLPLWVGLTLVAGSICSAQEVTGNLEGRVLDPSGVAVSDAVITASGPSLQGTRTAATDRRGFFRVAALPPGTYTVGVEHAAHPPLVMEQVKVSLGRTTGLEAIRLENRAALEERITVEAPRPLIDPRSTSSGGNIGEDYFQGVPTDRNYRSIAELLPHVNVSYLGDESNYGGGTGLDNRYFIDGMDVTDPWRGTTGTNLSYDFIREVQVRLGGYEAEYRSALGGTVNVITHSGGNAFQGNVWGYYTSDALAGDVAQSVVETRTDNFAKYDIGLSLSGPVVKDRLWYYAAYNPTSIDVDVQIPGLDFYPDRTRVHSFAGKLTWQIDGRNNLVATIVGDPTERKGVGDTLFTIGTPAALENPDPFLREIETGGYNLSLRGTHVVNEKLVVESFVSGVTRRDRNQAATARAREELLFIDFETGTWSGGSGLEVDNRSTQWTLGARLIWTAGDHEVRAGIEYRDNELNAEEGTGEIARVYRYNAALYQTWRQGVRGTVHNRAPSAYVQDSWRVTPRWRVNYGLRWDGQNLIGSDGEVAQRITDQYQPRLGFVYLPGKPGSQRLYGSAGRFYHDLSSYPISRLFMLGAGWEICMYDHDPRIDPSGCILRQQPRTEMTPPVEDLRGQHHDEFSLGYDRALGKRYRVGIRALYRTLRDGIAAGYPNYPDSIAGAWGNPGRGGLGPFPRASRDYRALELIAAKPPGGRFSFLASYVWSENEGNYSGLYLSDYELAFPNLNASFTIPEQLVDGDGLLPNDRTHVLKFSGSYRLDFGLTVGTFLTWQSGTPLNEFGGTTFPPLRGFVQPRGTAGSTPSIVNLNLRVTYDLSFGAAARSHSRFFLDVFHLFSDRDPVAFEQVHFFRLDGDGNQAGPNPLYGTPRRYQPAVSVRLGVQFGF